MLAAYAELRALGLLRRIARSLETLARIEADRYAVENEERVRRAKPVRMAELATMDVPAIERNWRHAHPRYDGTDEVGPE